MSDDYPEVGYDWDEEPPEVEFECTTCGRCCVSPGGSRTVVNLFHDDEFRMPLHVLKMVTEPAVPLYPDGPLVLKMVEKADGLGCVAFRGRVGKRCGCAIYEWRPYHCRFFDPGTDCLPYLDARLRVEEGIRRSRERMG